MSAAPSSRRPRTRRPPAEGPVPRAGPRAPSRLRASRGAGSRARAGPPALAADAARFRVAGRGPPRHGAGAPSRRRLHDRDRLLRPLRPGRAPDPARPPRALALRRRRPGLRAGAGAGRARGAGSLPRGRAPLGGLELAALLLWSALLRRRADARVGLGAALFIATNATFFRYGYSATTDAFALALQAAALYVLLARPGARAAAGAGAAGRARLPHALQRRLAAAGRARRHRAGGALQEKRGRATLLFTAGFLAPVVPWVLFSLAHGTGFSFQLHHNIAYEVFARAHGIPWDTYQRTLQPQFHSLADVIARDPGAVASRMLFNVYDHLRLDAASLLGWPLALCAVLGLGLGPRGRDAPAALAARDGRGAALPHARPGLLLRALLARPAALLRRRGGAPLRLAALRAGAGRRRRTWLKPALALLPLAFALAATVRVAGARARPAARGGAGRRPHPALARAPGRPRDRAQGAHRLPRRGRARALPVRRHATRAGGLRPQQGARWLYFSWPEAETRPQFWYLLDTTAVVPGLTPRRVTARHPAVLYEIGPASAAPAWFANDTLLDPALRPRARPVYRGEPIIWPPRGDARPLGGGPRGLRARRGPATPQRAPAGRARHLA